MTTMVLKFGPINEGWTELMLVPGARIVHLGEQDGDLKLWAICEPDSYPMTSTVRFYLARTGEAIPMKPKDDTILRHRATALTDGGATAWHLFEETFDVDSIDPYDMV